MSPYDYTTLQMRGIINAGLRDDKQAVQDLEGRADAPDILHIRLMFHVRLGHVDQALADVVKSDTMQPGLAHQHCETLEQLVGNAKEKNTTEEDVPGYSKRVSSGRALIAALKARKQGSSKVSNALDLY